MEKITHPFKPIIDENSEILILGSFPSVISRENDFYYGNKRNRFWTLLSKIFDIIVGCHEAGTQHQTTGEEYAQGVGIDGRGNMAQQAEHSYREQDADGYMPGDNLLP